MANTVQTIAAGDGNVNNGRTVVRTAKAAASGISGRILSLDSPGFSQFATANFDTNTAGPALDDRFDDPRYYTGDAIT